MTKESSLVFGDNRVTRLGGFYNIGRLFAFGRLCTITEVAQFFGNFFIHTYEILFATFFKNGKIYFSQTHTMTINACFKFSQQHCMYV
jgi:hypothetical protein